MKEYTEQEKINKYNKIIELKNVIRECEHKCNEVFRFASECNRNDISRSGFTEICAKNMQFVIKTLVEIEP